MKLPLSTARLDLRHFRAEDDIALQEAIFADAEVMRFGDGPQSLEWTRSWIQRGQQNYDARGYGPYAVIERQTQLIVGYCGLFHFPDIHGKAEVEIGYRFARSVWGKGYATEATTAVRDFAFNAFGLKRLIAIIDPANTASVRVAVKLGMKYEQDVMFEGYTHPDHVYVVTRL